VLVVADRRIDRVRAVHGLRVEADAFVLDGRRRSETSEALLRALGQNVLLESDINERAQVFHIPRRCRRVAHLQALHAGRDPVRLAMKYRAMRRSFGDFVRGTCSLFYSGSHPITM
jgi:hypothetical protein